MVTSYCYRFSVPQLHGSENVNRTETAQKTLQLGARVSHSWESKLTVYLFAFLSFLSSHLCLKREGRWGITNDFATSSLHFVPVLHCPLRIPGLPIPWSCLPTSSAVCLVFSPFHCALQDGFGQNWWTGDMTIPLQLASLYGGQEVFVWSNCLLCCRLIDWFLIIKSQFTAQIISGLTQKEGNNVWHSSSRWLECWPPQSLFMVLWHQWLQKDWPNLEIQLNFKTTNIIIVHARNDSQCYNVDKRELLHSTEIIFPQDDHRPGHFWAEKQ